MKKLITAIFALAILTCLVGCPQDKPKKKKDPNLPTSAKTEKDAIAIAKDYLKEKKAVSSDDEFSARPYEGGWIVKVERMGGFDARGARDVQQGSKRMVRVAEDGKIVEYLPGMITTAPVKP